MKKLIIGIMKWLLILSFIGFTTMVNAEMHVKILPPQPQILRPVGESAAMLCEVEGEDRYREPFSITWIDPKGTPITSTSGRIYSIQYSFAQKEFFITDIKSSDSGNYTCKAEIDEGSPSVQYIKSIVLQVYEERLELKVPRDKIGVDVGDDVLLECVAKSSFKPTVQWSSWGSDKLDDRYNQTDRGLLIRGVTKEDSGTYECDAQVEETGEREDKAIQLYIIPRNKNMYVKLNPDDLQHIKVTGQKLTVSCWAKDIVTNTQNLSINWLDPRGQIMQETSKSERIFIEQEQDNPVKKSLYITDVNTSDAGNYTCNVNIHDDTGSYSDTKSFMLQTYDKLDLEVFGPEAMAYLGQDVMLECSVTGSTKPSLNTTWILPKQLQLDARHRITDEGLLISGVTKKDAGVYTCVAVRRVTKEIWSHTIKLTVMPQIGSEQLLKVLEKMSDVQEQQAKLQQQQFQQLQQLQQQQLKLQQQTLEILNKNIPKTSKRGQHA